MAVYLIHFEDKISPDHTTQHYIGFADETGLEPLDAVARRLEEHYRGRGARLTQVAKERGIHWTPARVWLGGPATRSFERRLKNRKNAPTLCPICNPVAAERLAQEPGVEQLTGDELINAIMIIPAF